MCLYNKINAVLCLARLDSTFPCGSWLLQLTAKETTDHIVDESNRLDGSYQQLSIWILQFYGKRAVLVKEMPYL